MSQYATQQIKPAGVIPTLAAVTSSDTFVTGPRSFLHVKNGSGSSINVTLNIPGQRFGQPITPVVVAVAAGAEKLIGPLLPAEFEDPSTRLGTVGYSATTTVTAGVFSL